jgi:protease-4
VVRQDNGALNKIAVVGVEGLISTDAFDQGGFGMVEIIKAQLKRAEEDDRVKAVILKVDSPGGEVLASDEIYREIQHFQKQTSKPVIASMGNLAASGGYYISAPCHWIVANELTITGSIGVIMQGYNYRGLMDKVGLRPEVYKSGRFKDMLSGSRNPEDITPQERAMVQALIDETYGRFKEVVREGRSWSAQQNQSAGRALAKDWEEMADGRVLSGKEALKNGFVDELGNFQDAVSRAKKLANITKADLVLYQQIHDFSDFLRMFGKTDVKTIKVDVGMDMPKIQSGRLYFLSPILVH